MQTATNPAFERYEEVNRLIVDPLAVHKNDGTTHYVIYMGENIPHSEVPGGFILRGQVTPIVPFPKWDRWEDLHGVQVKRTRGMTDDADPHPEEGLYDIQPHPIFMDVMDKYGAWGVTEIANLENADIRQVASLGIDRVLFPDGVPYTYREQELALKEARKRIVSNDKLFAKFDEYYSGIIATYENAIKRGREFDTKLVDQTEKSIESKDSGTLSDYTDAALRAMRRLERPRRDHAVIESMDHQRQIVNSLPDLISALTPKNAPLSFTPEQLAALKEQIKQEMLAEAEAEKSASKPQPQQQRK